MISLDVAYRTYQDMRHDRLSQRTCRMYKSRVGSFIRFLSSEVQIYTVEDLENNPALIEEYAQHLHAENNLDVNSVRSHLTAVMHFVTSLKIRYSSFERPKMRLESPIILSPDEEVRLLSSLNFSPPKQRAIVLMLLHCGLRPMEVLSLRIDDLNMSTYPGSVLLIRQSQSTRLDLSQQLRSALNTWLLSHCMQTGRPLQGIDHAFTGMHGSAITLRGVEYIVKIVGERAQLRLSSRILRNTYLARLAAAGASSREIAARGDLRSMNSCQRYLLAGERSSFNSSMA
jgi:site-specific recombinase XerD